MCIHVTRASYIIHFAFQEARCYLRFSQINLSPRKSFSFRECCYQVCLRQAELLVATNISQGIYQTAKLSHRKAKATYSTLHCQDRGTRSVITGYIYRPNKDAYHKGH